MSQDPVSDRLDELYDELPQIECKGLCHNHCGKFELTPYDRQRIQGRVRRHVPAEPMRSPCSLLTEDGRCSVYDIRPAVCRVWGTVEHLACPYGCQPTRMLTVDEAAEWIARVYEVTGWPEDPAQMRFRPQDAAAIFGSPQARLEVIQRHGRPVPFDLIDLLD